MAPAVASQKRNLFSAQLADDVGVGRRSPWRVDPTLLVPFKSRHGVQSAAADYSNGWFHSCMSSKSTPPVEAG